MKKISLFIFLLTLFASCTQENIPAPQDEIPTIQRTETYDVLIEKDIVYGEGLSHETINSANTSTFPLKLDIFQPDNEVENRPAFVFIHGGGFIGGSKGQAQILKWANFLLREAGCLYLLTIGSEMIWGRFLRNGWIIPVIYRVNKSHSFWQFILPSVMRKQRFVG